MDAPTNPKETNQTQKQTSELGNLKIEFEATKRLLVEKEKVLKDAHSKYFPFQHKVEELKQTRDGLNEKNRKTREDIKNTENHLRYLNWILSDSKSEVSAVRTKIESIKREAKPFELLYQQAYSEYVKLQKQLDELNKKVKEAEVRLQPHSINRIWSEVFPVVVLVIVLALLSTMILVFGLPWYVAIIIFICALIAVLVFSIIQLRNNEKLSEENFLKFMLEAIKQIPELLKKLVEK